MRIEVAELSITLFPETDFEREHIQRVLAKRSSITVSSKPLDNDWPPRSEALVLNLPDPRKW